LIECLAVSLDMCLKHDLVSVVVRYDTIRYDRRD